MGTKNRELESNHKKWKYILKLTIHLVFEKSTRFAGIENFPS